MVEVAFDSSGRIRYVDERLTDRNADGILIERWEGMTTGAIRWGQHLPSHQFLTMDNPVKCAGCGGQPVVDEHGTLRMLNTESGEVVDEADPAKVDDVEVVAAGTTTCAGRGSATTRAWSSPRRSSSPSPCSRTKSCPHRTPPPSMQTVRP